MSTHYGIYDMDFAEALAWVKDLPDAEHIHVTIKDGTITAVPMESFGCDCGHPSEHRTCCAGALWADTQETL